MNFNIFTKKYVFLILIFLIIILFLCFFNNFQKNLNYNLGKSYLEKFYIKGDYVVFYESITINNYKDRDVYFKMAADVSEDKGLVSNNIAKAYEKDSFREKIFFIKANSSETFNAYFKVKKGIRQSKKDRLPPKEILFYILNQ